jgi:hypothetical protein
MRYVKTEDPYLVRDLSSGAIINMDDSYYKQVLAAREQDKKTKDVCREMNELKSELSEIKSLMQQFLNGRRDG